LQKFSLLITLKKGEVRGQMSRHTGCMSFQQIKEAESIDKRTVVHELR